MTENRAEKQLHHHKKQQCNQYQKKHRDFENTAHFAWFILAQPSRYDDLCANAKPKANDKQYHIKCASNGRCAQLALAHTGQKNRVGDVDDILGHHAENNWKG